MEDVNFFNLENIIVFNSSIIKQLFNDDEREIISEYIRYCGIEQNGLKLGLFGGTYNCDTNAGIIQSGFFKRMHIPIIIDEYNNKISYFSINDINLYKNNPYFMEVNKKYGDYKLLYEQYINETKNIKKFKELSDYYFNIDYNFFHYQQLIFILNEIEVKIIIFKYNNDIFMILYNYEEIKNYKLLINTAIDIVFNYFKNIIDLSINKRIIGNINNYNSIDNFYNNFNDNPLNNVKKYDVPNNLKY